MEPEKVSEGLKPSWIEQEEDRRPYIRLSDMAAPGILAGFLRDGASRILHGLGNNSCEKPQDWAKFGWCAFPCGIEVNHGV
jgi:hypothetical protein